MPERLVWSCTTSATLPLAAERLRHVLGRLGRRSLVVGRGRGHRDVALHTGVEGDDRDVGDSAWSISGAEALLSSAAKPIASGCLVSALVSMVIWFSTSVSLAGPSNVTAHSLLLGLLLGALLHRLPELVLEALGDDGDVRLVVAAGAAAVTGARRVVDDPPQAVMVRLSAAAATTP
jgi:hypothetical protein